MLSPLRSSSNLKLKSVSIDKKIQSYYTIVELIGEGSYGCVYLGVEKKQMGDKKVENNIENKSRGHSTMLYNNNKVALKITPIYQKNLGLPIDFYREIKVLHELNLYKHINIVELKSVHLSSIDEEVRHITMIFEYVEYDLKDICKYYYINNTHMNRLMIKSFLYQIITGINFLHANNILHRDIKPRNIFINDLGIVKLGDFGLSRFLKLPYNDINDCGLVATLWYRAPELLLGGTKKYTTAVDMWSIGCIMAELFNNEPVFPGNETSDRNDFQYAQFEKIASILGFPDYEWDDIQKLPFHEQYTIMRKEIAKTTTNPMMKLNVDRNARSNSLKSICRLENDPEALHLLFNFLIYDPKQRITAEMALQHRYFKDMSLLSQIPFDCNKYREMRTRIPVEILN